MPNQCLAKVSITSLADWNTRLLGELLGRLVSEGVSIGLVGELGSGKTTFVQGLAKGLAVPDDYPVASPTFTIVNVYPGRLKLAHIDLYRISSFEEFEGAGIAEFFAPPYVAAIEWFEKLDEIGAQYPSELLIVRFQFVDGNPDARVITLETFNEQLVETVRAFEPARRS